MSPVCIFRAAQHDFQSEWNENPIKPKARRMRFTAYLAEVPYPQPGWKACELRMG